MRLLYMEALSIWRLVMRREYVVRLTDDQRAQLKDVVSKGTAQAYRIKHAHILLSIDADGPGSKDEDGPGVTDGGSRPGVRS